MDTNQRNVGVAFGSLLASFATLICCVLPAVLVSIGAGATLIGLVSAVPQLVWLSEHKDGVFTSAIILIIASGALLWRARSLPCPVDADAARSCTRLRRVSAVIYFSSIGMLFCGALFAYLLPVFMKG